MWVLLVLSQVIAQSDLLCVVEIVRHGARSPIFRHHWDDTPWIQGMGQLTALGVQQHYLIGTELRKKYISSGFLSPNLVQQEIYVRSTDLNRTLLSVQSQLLGLYPYGPNLTQIYTDKIIPISLIELEKFHQSQAQTTQIKGIFPIKIHVFKQYQDNMLRGFKAEACPKMKVIHSKLQQQEEYLKRLAHYQKQSGLKEQLEKKIGEKVSFSDASWIADTILCRLWHGFSIPKFFTYQMFSQMQEIWSYLDSFYLREEGGSLASSVFFQEVLKLFDGALERISPVKLGIYSAHDTTLIGFTSSLGIFDGHSPQFASNLIFQLYKNNTVRTFYNDQIITHKNCEQYCQYSKFKSYLKSLITPKAVQVCRNLTEAEWLIVNSQFIKEFKK